MRMFNLPITLCEEIERMLNGFWWGRERGKQKGISWTSRDRLCRQEEGGLAFKKLKDINQALLTKQSWRLLTHLTSLMATVIRSKYYPNTSLLEAQIGHYPSFIWRSIYSTLNILKEGEGKRIGTGDNVLIWGDPWLPHYGHPYIASPIVAGLENAMVNILKTPHAPQWNDYLLRELFCARDRPLLTKFL